MGEIIQNPHSHRASLNGDEMSCIGTIFLTCLDLLAEYITTEKCVVVREDKRLLTVLFPDDRDGRTFTLKGERRDLPNPMSLRFTKFENTLMAHLSTFLLALMDAKVVQTKKAPAPKIAKQESSDDDTSDDDTSDETSEFDEEPAKKPVAKPLVAVAKNGSKTVKQESSSDEDSSEDESNDDSDDEPAKKAAAKPLGAVAKNGLKKGKQETSSDETGSNDESDDDFKPAVPLKKTSVAVAQKKKGDSSESDSDDDSDEEVPPKSKAPAVTIKKEDSNESESESDSEVEFPNVNEILESRLMYLQMRMYGEET
ncbi:Rho GTPase-activating protein 6 [Zea mays]|uniref:Rho GTPase-activating protein 6 n=1 Tax=Zea mays TaxID=4577 RepID=A0A317YAZ9_MAIZE|nr:Rho GTPase-activating protein 6 [Zea mays]